MKRGIDLVSADRLFVQLHHLNMVAAVAHRGSITGAGGDLGRSPSVVTRGVAEVESVLGFDLFERTPGGFRPNWYGGLLLTRIGRIENEIAAATAELGRMKGAGSISTASLRHLLYNGRKLLMLIHLADARSASGAAGTMDITQSGISMALSRLEEMLGIKLFYRNLQGMTPTDAGARLILHARRMRAELRHALSEMASVEGEPVGMVVIGALPLARTDLLPRAIGACLEQAPGVQVEAVEAPGETLISRLRSGEIDLVLTVPAAGFDDKGLLVEPLFGDELAVVAAADHPLAGRTGLSLGDVADQIWILPGSHSMSRAAFDSRFAEEGLEPPRPAVQTADLALIRQLLLDRRHLVALTSRVLVQHELGVGTMVTLDVDMPPIARGVILLHREGGLHSPPAAVMIEQLRAQAALHETGRQS